MEGKEGCMEGVEIALEPCAGKNGSLGKIMGSMSWEKLHLFSPSQKKGNNGKRNSLCLVVKNEAAKM